MQGRNILVVGVALFLGLIAVIIVNSYFSGIERRQQQEAAQQKMTRIVVASQDVGFAAPLTRENLRLVNWPSSSVPTGAFTAFEQATKGNRVAVRPMVTGEPVLASKVSGADGRATLSANLPVGKLAYTIPINDVSGDGGFVRPGDMVDVLLTRPIPGEGATANDKMTDVLLESVPVLGMDLVSDDSQTKPASAKTATLEVDTLGAQKLALSIQLGALSLALRNVADPVAGARATIIPRQLSVSNFVIPVKRGNFAPPSAPRMPMFARPPRMQGPRVPTVFGPHMMIVRGTSSSNYEVQRGF